MPDTDFALEDDAQDATICRRAARLQVTRRGARGWRVQGVIHTSIDTRRRRDSGVCARRAPAERAVVELVDARRRHMTAVTIEQTERHPHVAKRRRKSRFTSTHIKRSARV